MPFTFSHPAIVLPLTYLPKQWVSLTGLGYFCSHWGEFAYIVGQFYARTRLFCWNNSLFDKQNQFFGRTNICFENFTTFEYFNWRTCNCFCYLQIADRQGGKEKCKFKVLGNFHRTDFDNYRDKTFQRI